LDGSAFYFDSFKMLRTVRFMRGGIKVDEKSGEGERERKKLRVNPSKKTVSLSPKGTEILSERPPDLVKKIVRT